MATELHYMELTELTRRMHAGEISPVEVTEAQLARIEALDGKLKSYARIMPEIARAQARQAEAEIRRGEIRGPLHGAPIALKDLCWTAGTATAAGMTIYRDHVPDEDGTVTRRLREVGSVLLGKLQLTEGAFADHHPDIPPPLNPWNPDHWSGASSSGSGVATAAGLCYGSLGSDTGGSIRFPSAANGVTGLKPTWGRISRYGVFELAATLDHVGPMARSAADAAAMLGTIAGPDEKDPTASQHRVPNYLAALRPHLDGLRVGVDARWNSEGVDEEAARAVDEAARVAAALGAELREVRVPDPEAVIADWIPYCGIETAVAHEATYPARKAEYGPALAGLIETGRSLSAMDYQKMILRRLNFAGRLGALFETIDLLLIPAQAFASPTSAMMATLGEDSSKLMALLRFTCPFDMSGSPTVTLPCGFTKQGMPLGLQFVGPHFREDAVLRGGYAFQQATDWHRRHPALA